MPLNILMLCLTLIPLSKGLNENTIKRFLYSKELVEETKEGINGFKDIHSKVIGNYENKIQFTVFYRFQFCTLHNSTLNNIFTSFRRLRRPKFERSSERDESDESEYRYNQKPYDRDISISDYYYDDYNK